MNIKYHSLLIFKSRELLFLKNIKKDVENLPYGIWENTDIDDPNYPQKRKRLKGTVMHIQNKIQGYVNSKYGNNVLWNEFQNYSFFPQNGMLYEPFHEENNKIWNKGRCSYLCFLDKLIDFAKSEEYFNSIEWNKELFRWIVLFLVSTLAACLLFCNVIAIINVMAIKVKILLLLSIIMIVANILWKKNWRDLLPITSSVIIALVGLLI